MDDAAPTDQDAATFAFGAAIAVAAPGCSQTNPGNDAYYGSVDAAYGGPPHDAGTDAALVAMTDTMLAPIAR